MCDCSRKELSVSPSRLRVRKHEGGCAVRPGDTRHGSQFARQFRAEGQAVVHRQNGASYQNGDAAGHQDNSLKFSGRWTCPPRVHIQLLSFLVEVVNDPRQREKF